MIWQETHRNGQQKPLAIPTIRANTEEALAFTAFFTLALVATALRPLAVSTVLSAHFYICRAGLCENETLIGRGVVLI